MSRQRIPNQLRVRFTIKVMAAVAALLAVLVAAGCGDDASGSGTIDAISVTSPADGSTVGETFPVDVDTGEAIGEPDTGRQHLHFYFDVEPGDEDYDIVYSLPHTTRELSPGEHTVHVVVANGDHSETDVRETFTVMVDPAAGSSDRQDAPTTTGPARDPGSIPGY